MKKQTILAILEGRLITPKDKKTLDILFDKIDKKFVKTKKIILGLARAIRTAVSKITIPKDLKLKFIDIDDTIISVYWKEWIISNA